MSEQKKAEEFGITEDDVSEIRQVELETRVREDITITEKAPTSSY